MSQGLIQSTSLDPRSAREKDNRSATLERQHGQRASPSHDVLQQHLRALKAMDKEPSAPFITSLIEMKLDADTRFEWQKSSQESTDVPPYTELLEFLNLRAQASESTSSEQRRQTDARKHPFIRSTSHASSVSTANNHCVMCKTENHPLYACTRFKALSRDKMIETLKSNNPCMNCLRPGHYAKQCTSLGKCRRCQRPHHTLIHNEAVAGQSDASPQASTVTTTAYTNAATGFTSNTLLMTCQLLVHSPDGATLKARALLDSASSTSFISERLTQALRLPKSSQSIRISGIAGLSHRSPLHSTVSFDISPTSCKDDKINVSAVAVPRVTSDLPLQPIPLNATWSHLSGLPLADPDFGRPGRIDVLLGVDVYIDVVKHGRRTGPPNSPVAFETKFGWVLAGRTKVPASSHHATSYHVSDFRRRPSHKVLGDRRKPQEFNELLTGRTSSDATICRESLQI